MWDNFAKYSRRDVTLLDTGYDYLSLMHYPTYAFSKNGGQTIGTIYPTYEEPGTRNDFSYVDIYRITALYRCGGTGINFKLAFPKKDSPPPDCCLRIVDFIEIVLNLLCTSSINWLFINTENSLIIPILLASPSRDWS